MFEHSIMKPFNPLLGETYEFVNDSIECLSEKVSHHPPIMANICRGKKHQFVIWDNQQAKSKFTGTSFDFSNEYRQYIELEEFGEKYEIILPTISTHNIVIGSMYNDIGGISTINSLTNDTLKCELKYSKRGWYASDYYKVEGQVVEYPQGN